VPPTRTVSEDAQTTGCPQTRAANFPSSLCLADSPLCKQGVCLESGPVGQDAEGDSDRTTDSGSRFGETPLRRVVWSTVPSLHTPSSPEKRPL
jgi:hypothetical protein